jgi:4a-hydroxytetrahydrobiopterin dehydratase
MKSRLLTKAEVESFVQKSPTVWQKNDQGKLQLKLEVENFSKALELLNRIALVAEELNHHPDLCLKNYREVEISLYTHSAKGLTVKDVELAKRIEKLI